MTKNNIQYRVRVTIYKNSGKYYTHENIVTTENTQNREAFIKDIISKLPNEAFIHPNFTLVTSPMNTLMYELDDELLYAIITPDEIKQFSHLINTLQNFTIPNLYPRNGSTLTFLEMSEREPRPYLVAIYNYGVFIGAKLAHSGYHTFTNEFKNELYDMVEEEAGKLDIANLSGITVITDDVEYGKWFTCALYNIHQLQQ